MQNKYIFTWLNAIVRNPNPTIVRNMDIKENIRNCHLNVKEAVEKYGGSHIYGWYIQINDNISSEFYGIYDAMFHSNWLQSDGELISVTPDPKHEKFHIFLHDPIRKYDWVNRVSYNNRRLYTSEYKAPKWAKDPSRNTNYFVSSTNADIDRDKFYEKYSIPQSKEEMWEQIPQKYKIIKNGELGLSAEGMRYVQFKFSVGTS
jgi:hypothetical protein